MTDVWMLQYVSNSSKGPAVIVTRDGTTRKSAASCLEVCFDERQLATYTPQLRQKLAQAVEGLAGVIRDWKS